MANKKIRMTTAAETNAERSHMIAANMNFAASEAYKLLRTNLMFSFSDSEHCHVVGMTSSYRGEGKSLTSINLAYTLAETGKEVLLIEGDMRLPTLSGRLQLKPSPGLSNLLVGMNSVSEAFQIFSVPLEEKEIKVNVMVAGDIPPNPSELLGSKRMESLMGVLRKHYDYIILDLPPVTMVTDALVASKLVDGIVVVVRSNHAVQGALAETIRQLKLVDARILGFAFNGSTDAGGGYYKGKGYYKK